MKSSKPKVLFEINGEPMALGPLRVLLETCDEVVAVVGHQAELVQETLKAYAGDKVKFCRQEKMIGTGDAVRSAVSAFPDLVKSNDVVVFNGDLPLIKADTLKAFVDEAKKNTVQSACLSYESQNPFGLGRIIRNTLGAFDCIREEVDASDQERLIKEVNAGVYFFQGKFLCEGLDKLLSNNKKNEFYLTDLLGAAHGSRSGAVVCKSVEDLMGVNTTFELAQARKISQKRLFKTLCEEHGVEIECLESVYIEASVKFEGAAYLGLGAQLKGKTTLSEGVRIEGSSLIEDSFIGPNTVIDHGCVIRASKIGSDCRMGPMAHLRPETVVEDNCKVGNFVEIKKSHLAQGVKASHLSYLGDATIGKDVNIGCGTITCNYDGFQKHHTYIEEGAFIGSDSQLIAPIRIGKGAYIASGSTITKDIPEGALALTRAELAIKQGYAARLAGLKKSAKKK